MNIYGIDLTSEQLNVLKVFYKHNSILLNDIDRYIPTACLDRTVDLLKEWNFLCDNFRYDNFDKYIPDAEHDKIYITTAGENAFLLSRDQKRDYFKKLFMSKWCDVIISFATALLTSVLAHRLLP